MLCRSAPDDRALDRPSDGVEQDDRARRLAVERGADGPAELLQAAIDRSGYLGELEAERTIEAAIRRAQARARAWNARARALQDDLVETWLEPMLAS